MTKKRYYENPYLTTDTAKVLSQEERGDAVVLVLDQTIFYPEGGGQPCDLGTIDGIAVLDVQEQDDVVYHTIAQRVTKDEVTLELDWARRLDHMQQHTGEHILSGLFLKLYGGNNRGFHLGEEIVTIDIDIDPLTQAQLDHVEQEANFVIQSGRPVETATTDRAHLAAYGPRKLVNAEGAIRVVIVQDADVCACCGTHVQNASEIALVKILKAERHKGMSRISFVCGNRALQDYCAKHAILTNLKQQLSAEEQELPQRLERLLAQLNEQSQELYGLRKEQALAWAENFAGHALYAPDTAFTQEQMDQILKARAAETAPTVIGSLKELRILAYDPSHDLGAWFKEHIRTYGGSGGGKGARAQGKFERVEDLTRFIEALWAELGAGIEA